MKFDYDLRKSFFKGLDLASGVAMSKNEFKKDADIKIRGYLAKMSITFLKLFAVFFLLSILSSAFNQDILVEFMAQLCGLIVGSYTLCIISFFLDFFAKRKYIKKGTLEINKKGITDSADEYYTMIFPFEIIEYIVIKNNFLVFVSSTPMYILVDTNDVDITKVISTIKKYSDVPIINYND